MARMTIQVHDVAHKWVDDTKTTTILSVINDFGSEAKIAYIHSNETVEQVLDKKEKYEEILIKTIKDNIEWV